jgi:NAD(P)H-hydrate epimerase
MRALEQAAVDAGATWSGLMEQAGRGVAQVCLHLLGSPGQRRILVLVGPGNNGGDGLVAACHLHDAGALVTLYLWRRRDAPADHNWQYCRDRGLPEVDAAHDSDGTVLRQLLAEADLVVDGLLGMGVSRPVEGELAQIVSAVNAERHAPARSVPFILVAIDLPTGIDSDSGRVLGVALRADVTVATGLAKRGLLQQPGRTYAGELRLAEIGLSQELLEEHMSEVLDAAWARRLLPPRPDDSHKGTFGKVMVVAGSFLYPGAASLATAGAARVGAGLVTLANGRSTLGGPGRLPEVTLRPLTESEPGAIGEAAADELSKHLEGYDALLVGPGLGREKPLRRFLERLLGLEQPRQRGQIGFRVGVVPDKPVEPEQPQPRLPLVIDADALSLISEIDSWWEHLPHERCVLTPHPGEMKRLLKLEDMPSDLVGLAEDAASRWRQVVVLKGATTIVARPGASLVHDGANAALATAGTGDVLAGAIAGLLAQGLTPFDAAALGVYLHGAAGRLVREELGAAGALASDLLPRLPLAIKALT